MKRILAFAIFLVALCANAQLPTYSYVTFELDPSPSESLFSPHVVRSGLGPSVSTTTIYTKIVEISNKLNYGSEINGDGELVTYENVVFMYENGFDAIVTLDWAVNTNTTNGVIYDFLDLKQNRLVNQRCRVYKLKDGSILVMRKIQADGNKTCWNVFVRLLRAKTVPVTYKEEKKYQITERETKTYLIADRPQKVVVQQNCCYDLPDRNVPMYPLNAHLVFTSGVVVKKGTPTPIKPPPTGGGDPGGDNGNGNPTGGGDPGTTVRTRTGTGQPG